MATNPNPQPWSFYAYESPKLKVTMTPAEDITGQHFQLNIRTQAGVVVLQSTTFTVSSLSLGIFQFQLTSTQSGVTVGGGDFLYDVWRIDSGSEKDLVIGPLNVKKGRWKP